MIEPGTTPEQLAQRFHEAYEGLAPAFGYRTREASAVPWPEVPEANRQLMVAVCAELLGDSPGCPVTTNAGNLPCRIAVPNHGGLHQLADGTVFTS